MVGLILCSFMSIGRGETTSEVLLSHVVSLLLSFFLLFPFLLHAMYKAKHLFCSVMRELMWLNQTIIAVLVQSALQPFVSSDNTVYCWNADFVTFQHKAASHKSSCVAVKLPPF